MGKACIIAEKPDQAREYAAALNGKRKNGYYEVPASKMFPDGAVITWCVGHLLEIPKPGYFDERWAKWDLDTLPIKLDKVELQVKEKTKKQFDIVKKILIGAHTVVVATDIDAEGENIAWSILEHLNLTHKNIKRLWVNSLDKEVLLKGFANLKNGTDYYSYYLQARTRQISDYIIGMNASPLYSLLLQQKGIHEYSSFSVGRVQTPLLSLIYKREKAIAEFKQKPFYENVLQVQHMKGSFEVKGKNKHFEKEKAIQQFVDEDLQLDHKSMSEISKVEKTIEKEYSPQLFTLSSIQTKVNKKFKYSPADTLKYVQNLYEKKLVTYPRTDIPYITTGEYAYLKEQFTMYQKIFNSPVNESYIEPGSKYVNDKKVVEHHGIIPTRNIPSKETLQSLSMQEMNVYKEIVLNTIAMFYPPYLYEQTVITVKPSQHYYQVTGKAEKDLGWRVLYSDGKKEDSKEHETCLPSVEEGDAIQIIPKLREGKTTKPKRFTEGDLIPLMKNPLRDLTDEELESDDETVEGNSQGLELGTEATRAPIIETLKDRQYIEIKKNLVYVTPKGVVLCKAVEGSLLSSPEMTAKWEAFLRKIGTGERKPEQFIEMIYKFVDKLLVEVPEKIESLDNLVENYQKEIEEKINIGSCPCCKVGHMRERDTFYSCSNPECKQTLSKTLLSKKISFPQMKKLLTKGKTDLIKGFKGKKEFDAYLTLEQKENQRFNYKINFK